MQILAQVAQVLFKRLIMLKITDLKRISKNKVVTAARVARASGILSECQCTPVHKPAIENHHSCCS
jgi:hypothetical protein